MLVAAAAAAAGKSQRLLSIDCSAKADDFDPYEELTGFEGADELDSWYALLPLHLHISSEGRHWMVTLADTEAGLKRRQDPSLAS